jgi:hypothetical protein
LAAVLVAALRGAAFRADRTAVEPTFGADFFTAAGAAPLPLALFRLAGTFAAAVFLVAGAFAAARLRVAGAFAVAVFRVAGAFTAAVLRVAGPFADRLTAAVFTAAVLVAGRAAEPFLAAVVFLAAGADRLTEVDVLAGKAEAAETAFFAAFAGLIGRPFLSASSLLWWLGPARPSWPQSW